MYMPMSQCISMSMDICQYVLVYESVYFYVYGVCLPSDSLHGHTDLVMSLAVSADGCLLLSGSKDNTAMLWSLGTGGIHDMQLVFTARGHSQSVTAVALPR